LFAGQVGLFELGGDVEEQEAWSVVLGAGLDGVEAELPGASELAGVGEASGQVEEVTGGRGVLRMGLGVDGEGVLVPLLGLDVEGLIPRPDMVVSTSYLCDGGVKFFHNISQLYGCDYYLMDVPYHNTGNARRYLASQMEELASIIAEKQGKSLDLDKMAEALRLSNEAREYMLKINELRRAVPCPLSGSDALSYVLDMGFFGFGSEVGVKFFKTLYEELKARVESGQGAVDREKYRVLWLHQIRPYYPNEVISHLEEMGASVCFGESNHVYWEPLDEANPFESLAAKVLSNPSGGPLERRSDLALELAERYDVDGVIHFSHWGCRQSCGGEYVIRDLMRKKGIPMLILGGDGTDSRNYSKEQTKLRLDAFLEMLEAGK